MGVYVTLSSNSLFNADVMVAVNMLNKVMPIRIQRIANSRPRIVDGVLSPYLQ